MSIAAVIFIQMSEIWRTNIEFTSTSCFACRLSLQMVIFVCISTMFYGRFCSDFAIIIIEKFLMLFYSCIFKLSMQKWSKVHNSRIAVNCKISLFCSFAICVFLTKSWLVVLVSFLNLIGCMKKCAIRIRAEIALLRVRFVLKSHSS